MAEGYAANSMAEAGDDSGNPPGDEEDGISAAAPAEFEYDPRYDEEADVPTNRPKYRRGRRETAVKVYTIALESRYLIVRDVPAYGVVQDLIKLFAIYGPIQEYRLLDDAPCEQFTDVYRIKFATIDAARAAKRKMDGHSFFGKQLKVRYAPEYETVEETREKILGHRDFVVARLAALGPPRPPPPPYRQLCAG
eukprot:tig00020943_g16330.t1